MSESVALIAAATFFLIFAALAYIVFRMLKKTVKVALRMAIVAAILLIAVVGSVSFWYLGAGRSSVPKSKTSRTK